MSVVQEFCDWGMKKLKQFTVLDVAVFKVCLLSIGALIGMYLVKPFKKLAPLVWVVAIGSYCYLIWRMVIRYDD